MAGTKRVDYLNKEPKGKVKRPRMEAQGTPTLTEQTKKRRSDQTYEKEEIAMVSSGLLWLPSVQLSYARGFPTQDNKGCQSLSSLALSPA